MGKKSILVVEDEAIIAMDIKSVLDEEGYQTFIDCFSVDQAKDFISNIQPDLVIIDINLKGSLSGIDLAEWLLGRDNVPFMFLSSYSDRLTLEQVKSTRPYGYLVKPYKPADLITMVYFVLNNFAHRKIDIVRTTEPIQSDIPYQIKMVVDYINKNISEKIELASLAALTRWETEHFGRVFKKEMGVTPYQYIINRKVEYAKSLLIETNYTLSEIAFNVGFGTYSNFFNAFKKVTNTTPEFFRNYQRVKKQF